MNDSDEKKGLVKLVVQGDASFYRYDDLPYYFSYNFDHGNVVIYNDEIHVIGYSTVHYKWDGITWSNVSTIPESSPEQAVVLNDEIHYFVNNTSGGGYHYKWDGISWTQLNNATLRCYAASCVIFNNEMHLLFEDDHYKYNPSDDTWSSVSTVPTEINSTKAKAITFNNKIHVFGYDDHYTWDGNEWTRIGSSFSTSSNSDGWIATVYNNEIHVFGGRNTNHRKFDGTLWSFEEKLPYEFFKGGAIEYNGDLHLLGTNRHNSNQTNVQYKAHYNLSHKVRNINLWY